MQGNWVLKVYNNSYNREKAKKIIRKKNTKIQGNYYVQYYIEKPKKEIFELKCAGVKYSCYKVEYERASNYRKVFFDRTKGPYKCRYCNKKISKNQLFVDHIIPVARVQKSRTARFLLSIKGCSNVNDIRNLAPACRHCNSSKSDKLGFWVIRGWLGKYKAYWVILRILQFLIFTLTILGCMYVCKFFIN